MRKTIIMAAVALFLCVVSAAAQSGELVDITVEKFGYAFTLPREFGLNGKIDGTTTWIYRPDASTAPLGPAVEKEPALTIWVNRVPMETPDPKQLFDINKKSDMDAVKAPDSSMKELAVLDIKDGYGYRYKESDKTDPAGIHRWIVKVFGNGGVYTVCLAGPFREFETWGPIYERVIASFVLIPLKAG